MGLLLDLYNFWEIYCQNFYHILMPKLFEVIQTYSISYSLVKLSVSDHLCMLDTLFKTLKKSITPNELPQKLTEIAFKT